LKNNANNLESALLKMKSSKANTDKNKVLKIAAGVMVVFFMTNLSAIVESFINPEIPYFDKEHLIVGSITGFVSFVLLGLVMVYVNWLQDINSKNKTANEDLTESEEKYRVLLNGSSYGVLAIDIETYRFLFSNPAIGKLFGYTDEEFQQISIEKLVPKETLDRVMSEFASQMEGKRSVSFTQACLRKDGTVFYADIAVAPIILHGKRCCVGFFMDVTDRRHAEEALRESEAIHRNLIERMLDGVYKSTPDGKFIDVNPALVKMLGYDSKEELLAIDIKKQLYFEPADRESLLLLDKYGEVTDYPVKKKDGSTIWVEDHGWYIMGENGEVLFHEGITRDITERKHAEEVIRLKNEQLVQANAEKDKFFSIIAHDLRSPFHPLLGYTRLLVENLPTLKQDEIHKMAVNMSHSASKLFNLLENLLEWSRMQRGLTTFEPEAFLLMPKLSESLLMTAEAIASKQIELRYDISEDLTIFADNNMFESIVRNLVSNAIKFTKPGGEISIAAKPADDHWVEIKIKDNGVGMNQEILENIFKLNADTNRRGTEGEPSSGLGLFICKDFIEKHGGKLWVESEVDRGSTFSFTLPASNHK
jgi:PAS domain S-box-containing protein